MMKVEDGHFPLYIDPRVRGLCVGPLQRDVSRRSVRAHLVLSFSQISVLRRSVRRPCLHFGRTDGN